MKGRQQYRSGRPHGNRTGCAASLVSFILRLHAYDVPEAIESMEDHNNTHEPLDGPDPPEVPDETLGGYQEVHTRSPAFEGCDGQPYTVSIEVESVGDPLNPFVGYLVFPRWAESGLGIVGHVQTPVLSKEKGQAEARRAIDDLPLIEVKRLLDEAIRQKDRTP